MVYATGTQTFFGRAAALVGSANQQPNLQKVGFWHGMKSESAIYSLDCGHVLERLLSILQLARGADGDV